jgi:hypothetical protein
MQKRTTQSGFPWLFRRWKDTNYTGELFLIDGPVCGFSTLFFSHSFIILVFNFKTLISLVTEEEIYTFFVKAFIIQHSI